MIDQPNKEMPMNGRIESRPTESFPACGDFWWGRVWIRSNERVQRCAGRIVGAAAILFPVIGIAADVPAPAPKPPPPSVPVVQRYTELRHYTVPEARQGVCADGEFFWAINNFTLAKYRRADGVRIATWSCEEGKPLTHLNAAYLHEGRLYCAHSNFIRVCLA